MSELILPCLLLFFITFFFFLLSNGDVEPNTGPKEKKQFSLSCCHWNEKSLVARDYAKVTSLEAK